MGMGRVRLVKTTPIPINIIPTCKQFGKKTHRLSRTHNVFIAPYSVGGVMDNGVGVVDCHLCNLSLKHSGINGKMVQSC